jgi:hypothetical protein
MRRHTGSVAGLAACLGLLVGGAGVAGPQVPLGDPALDQALRQAGWEVKRSAGEGLVLSPPQMPAAAPTAAADPAPGVPATGAPDWDRLRGLGWRVERSADGSTLLYPPAPPVPVPGVTPANRTEKALDALLQERGWRVERDAQGAMLLYPRTAPQAGPSATPSQAGSTVVPALGVVTAPVRDAAVELPVDRWAEARTIADAWLAEHGAPGWRVGKIRQVHRVYMVSIVDEARPPKVIHQIAITSGNGLVVVLN